MTLKIRGPVFDFGLENKHLRSYTLITVPFSEARKFFKPNRYQVLTGDGEQREIYQRHASSLKKAMLEGNFTPSTATVGLTETQRERLDFEDTEEVFGEENLRYVSLELEEDETLPLLDAGHRMEALESIFKEGEPRALIQPISALVLLDGNKKLDFINLQAGKAVDASHMLSLKVQENSLDEKVGKLLKFGLETAKYLSLDCDSPFYNLIKFDSKGKSLIPINSLMSKNASDLSTSLVGGAKIAKLEENKKPEWYAKIVVDVYKELKNLVPNLLTEGYPLCPPPKGTKGGAGMLVGLGNLMLYRLIEKGREEIDNDDISKLITAVKKVLNISIDGNFAAARKRGLMGDLCQWMLADVSKEIHEGVPIKLILALSPSAFGVARLPKTKKEKNPKKKKIEAQESDDGFKFSNKKVGKAFDLDEELLDDTEGEEELDF
jgi:hypothetical protein